MSLKIPTNLKLLLNAKASAKYTCLGKLDGCEELISVYGMPRYPSLSFIKSLAQRFF